MYYLIEYFYDKVNRLHTNVIINYKIHFIYAFKHANKRSKNKHIIYLLHNTHYIVVNKYFFLYERLKILLEI